MEWDFESKDPAQKRETWDPTNSSALQRLNRFKENKPFDCTFRKILSGC